jgi:hypothetical protein
MNSASDREDQALDALIVLAMLPTSPDGVDAEVLCGAESVLTPEDRHALDRLGDDLVARIMAGDKRSCHRERTDRPKHHRQRG